MIRTALPILPLISPLLLAAPENPRLAPAKALPGAFALPGLALKIEADAARHSVKSPTALAFDAQGRVLVTETHRFGNGVLDARHYPEWYLDDLASRNTADRRALHEKWKGRVPLEQLTAKSEIVRLLADTDGDGSPDESKVFADGFNDVLDGTLAGIFEYEGTVFTACIPKLLALRDTNGDGSADERGVIAEGFGARISLSGHDLNGFALGPDGRIYGTIGDRGFSVVTREGVKLDYPNEGAVFRFDPDGSGFELFHTGLRNPKEIAFDELGNPFTVDNNSDQGDRARIVYLIEGGDSGWEMEHQTMFSFHRNIGLAKLPPNRWMAERIWEPANPEQPAFIVPPCANLTSGPSGLTHHPGSGFLESEAGRFLVCDYRGSPAVSGIWSFRMEPDGAGMKLADARRIVRGVAATDLEFSWDGRLFVTDFGGGWKSHDGGRLLSLDAGEGTWRADEVKATAKLVRDGFESRGAAELSFLLRHPDFRVRLRAQLALTRKPEALAKLAEAAVSTERTVRLHGIWGLGILARRGAAALPSSGFAAIPSSKLRSEAESRLTALLEDPDEEIRAQVLRTLCDATTTDSAPLPVGHLLADPSPRVRAFAALLAGKRRMAGYFGQVCTLLEQNDNRDPYLRHAGAFALQRIADDSSVLRVMSTHPSAAVRLATVVAMRRMKSPHLAEFIRDADPRVADEAIRAICDLDLTGQRASVAFLLEDPGSRQWSPFMLRRLLHNAFRCGGSEHAGLLLDFAADPKQPADLRAEAFRLLENWCEPFPADQFTGHWRPLPKRDPSTIVPLLREKLPALLQSGDLALGAALGLIRQHRIDLKEVDEATLRGIVRNTNVPENARETALAMLIERQPSGIEDELAGLIDDAPDSVAITALRRLATAPAETAAAALEKAIRSGRTATTREAWKLLEKLPGDAADRIFIEGLDQLRASKATGPSALELMDAARARRSAPVAAALAALEKSLEETGDPLAKWHPALEGGDPAAGRDWFTSHPTGECMRCHQLGNGHDTGGNTAPDLAGVAKRAKDRRYLLESLVNPNAVVAPGYGTVLLTFPNGATLGGIQTAATEDHIDLETEGRLVRVKRSDIASVSPPVSAMPPMADLMKPAEIRDLIAFLATLTEDAAPPAPAEEPEPFDPSTLAPPPPPAATANAADPEVMRLGRTQYMVCAACHGQNGEGGPAGPPIAGSEWVTGPPENLIRIQLRGLEGPITVKGQTYDFPGGMAPLAYQDDKQIAAVLTYIRQSFGNSAPAVTPDQVAALRGEVGKPKLRAADLIPPVAAPAAPAVTGTAAPAAPSNKYDDLRTSSGAGRWIIAGGALALLGLLIRVLSKRRPEA